MNKQYLARRLDVERGLVRGLWGKTWVVWLCVPLLALCGLCVALWAFYYAIYFMVAVTS